MHNNYYLLRKLTERLAEACSGLQVTSCFSQNKDELVLEMASTTRTFTVRATCQPAFASLSFPLNYQRARKNSVDLFEPIIGQKVTGTTQFENERAFTINFGGHYKLLFKMHGPQTNVVLFEDQRPIEVFRNTLKNDLAIELERLDRPISWDYDYFIANQHALGQAYFTFGKYSWQYLQQQGFQEQDTRSQYEMLIAFRDQLASPTFFLSTIDKQLRLVLFELGNVQETFNDPIDALNAFVQRHQREHAFLKEHLALTNDLNKKISATQQYIEKTQIKLRALEADDHYRHWADLLMANLGTINEGADRVVVSDFYDAQKSVTIPLKPGLSPQKCAERYYSKAKNQSIQTEHLRNTIQSKVSLLKDLETLNSKVAAVDDLKALRALATSTDLSAGANTSEETLPFHEFYHNGYRILVGKNAAKNDELTLRHSYKEDLWLHAKDVAGSHVLIKHQAGKNFPSDVIERAAQLAAYYSKRKNESLCPVVVTPKKFVRKRKGDPPGAVVVERERVIMVVPAH